GDGRRDDDEFVHAGVGELAQPRRDGFGRSGNRIEVGGVGPVDGRVPDGDIDRGGSGDLTGIAADVLGDGGDARVGFGETFGGVAVPLAPDVPCVDVRQGGSQDALPRRADHEWRSSGGPRQKDGVPHLFELAVEGHPLADEEAADDVEALLEPRGAAVEGDPERLELRGVPAGPEAEYETAAADLVDRGRPPRQQPGRRERGARHQRADRRSLRLDRQPGERRPRVPWAAFLAAIAAVEQVVADPQGVEASLLGDARDGGVLGPWYDVF